MESQSESYLLRHCKGDAWQIDRRIDVADWLKPIDAQRLKKTALREMIRVIREEEPAKPSTRLSLSKCCNAFTAIVVIE
jgi:hypothetical protein